MNDILIKYDYSWSIIRTKHNAKVRSVSNLSKIDKIICGIINNTENKEIHFEDLGLILGLGTRDILEYSDDVKFYKDSSEINILKGFIKECSKYHLVEMEKESSIIKLTEWGIHALNHGEKYQYHDCTLSSYKHVNFKLKDNENSYPFFELDLTVDIVEKETLKKIYDFPEEKNDLTKELIYQLSNSKQKGKYIIDGVDDKSLIGKTLTHKKVDVCLGADEQSLTFEYEGTELPEISSSISLLENNILQTYLQRKGIYLHLLSGSELLTSDHLLPFIEDDFFDAAKVVQLEKIDWFSDGIFNFFLDDSISDSSTWDAVSKTCPIDLILDNISLFNEYVYWPTLTQRAEISIILDNTLLEWDIEIIIDRFSEDELLQFLENKLDQVPKVSDDDSVDTYLDVISAYQWNVITQKLSDENLEKHLFNYPLDFRFITVNKEALCRKILVESNDWKNDIFSRKWDWIYISSNYDINFLSQKFSNLKNYLDASSLFLQIAKDEERLTRFLKGTQTLSLRERLIENEFKLSSHHKVFINEEILDLLDLYNLLGWGQNNINGFEINAAIEWTNNIVKKYGHHIQSDEAFELVSKRLDSIEIAINNNHLPWNWKNIVEHYGGLTVFNYWEDIVVLIEQNDEVLSEAYLILSKKISLAQAITLCSFNLVAHRYIDWETILKNSIQDEIELHFKILNDLLADIECEACILILTEKVSLELILENKELDWDWGFVSRKKIVLEDAEEYFDDFAEFLDWEHIVKNLYSKKEFNDIDTLTELAWYIDKGEESIKKSAWKYITQEIDVTLIWLYIRSTRRDPIFHWDWDVISSSSVFLKEHIDDLRKGYKQFFIRNRRVLNWSLFTENPYYTGFLKKVGFEEYEQWFYRIDDLVTPIAKFLDWSILSANKHINWNSSIVKEYFNYWDWKVFSKESNYLTKRKADKIIFNYSNLNFAKNKLDFNILSSRDDISIEPKFIIDYGHENLNWEAISSNPLFDFSWGIFFDKGDTKKTKKLDRFNNPLVHKEWNFQALSKRKDISFNTDVILELSGKDWDWEHFSSQNFITNNLLAETLEKQWDWVLVSQNSQLVFDKNLITTLLKKDSTNKINWNVTSSYPKFHISKEILSGFSSETLKSLNWNALSGSNNLEFEVLNAKLLDEYSAHWDWQELVVKNKITLDTDLLLKHYKYIPSSTIAKYISIEVLTDSFSKNIKEYINWSVICRRDDFSTLISSTGFIEDNKKYLKWEVISRLTNFQFTEELINTYYPYWDWHILRNNPNIVENHELFSFVESCIENDDRLKFLIKINEQGSIWKGRIYHFSNIDNAVKIIRDKKIKSRNTANQISNSAGSVVNSRRTAHKYSRFYFRPHTQTQFYNEFLGVDIDNGYKNKHDKKWHSYYDIEYSNLHFPKCPIPIYFEFSLQEILFLMFDKCKVSTGNMQRKSTKFGSIDKMFPRFNFSDLYSYPEYTPESWAKYRDFAQQEFMIEDEIDFSKLNYIKIICHSEEDKKLLLNLLGSSKSDFNKYISVDSEYYRGENPCVTKRTTETDIVISTERKANGYFILKGESIKDLEILKGDFTFINKTKIRFNSYLKIQDTTQKIKIEYIDEINTKWLVYSNYELNTNVN